MKKRKIASIVRLLVLSIVGLGLNSTAWAQPERKAALQKSQKKPVLASRAVNKLPDLIVSNIRLIKDCKMQITIKNIGTAGVPASGYDLQKGAAIQMFNGSKAWGGIRLGAIDRSGRLKTPGASVRYVWFPGAANLALAAGTHSIKLVVDNNNAVKERNENNNSKTSRLRCKKPAAGKEKRMLQKEVSRFPAGMRPQSPGLLEPPKPNMEPPPPPEPDNFILKTIEIEAVPVSSGKEKVPGSFQVASVQFSVVLNPNTNQRHLAAAVIFNRNIDAATVLENQNIRLLKQNEDNNFWYDASTQNNVVRITPNFITWLSGAPVENGKYKMHLRGTIKSESGLFLDCDGDGVGEGGYLPAYESQIYQVNLFHPGEKDLIEGMMDLLGL